MGNANAAIHLHEQRRILNAEAFGDLTAPLFSLSSMPADEDVGQFRADEWYADRFSLGVIEAPGYACHREKTHIQDIEHMIVVCRMLYGQECGAWGDQVIERGPGLYIFWIRNMRVNRS